MKRKSTLIFLVLLVFGLIGFASCDDAKDALDDALEDAANPFDTEDYLDKDKNLLCLDPAIKWTTNTIGQYESDNAKEFDEKTKDDLAADKPGSELFSEVWDKAADTLKKVGVEIPTLTICSDAVSDSKKEPASPAVGAVEEEAAEAVGDPVIVSGVDGEDVGQECIKQIGEQQKEGTDEQAVIILVDTTGSMSTSIASVKEDIEDIIDEVVTQGGASVLVAELQDASVDSSGNRHCGLDDPAYSFMPAFTTDKTVAKDWVNDNLEASGGCDLPESLYGGIYTLLTNFSGETEFVNSDNRMLIVITDADPIDTDTTYDGRKDLAWLDTTGASVKDDVTAADAEKIMADNFVQYVLFNVTW